MNVCHVIEKSRGWVAVCLAGFLLPLLATGAVGRTAYSILLGEYGSRGQAEEAQGKFQSEFSPLSILEVPGGGVPAFRLVAGEYPCYGDAEAALKGLVDQGKLQEGSVISQDVGDRSLTDSRAPVHGPFDTDGLSSTGDTRGLGAVAQQVGVDGTGALDPALLQKPVSTMTPEELLLVGTRAPRNAEGVPALERFLQERPSDPAANRARLRLSRRLMGKKDFPAAAALLTPVKAGGSADERSLAGLYEAYVKDYEGKRGEALQAFRGVADTSSYCPSVRRDAMRRAAGIAHATRDYPTAWAMFDQIERSAGSVEEAAEARMQKSGLAFELAGRGKGNWDEVRELCRSVRQIANAPRASVATADLIYVETYYFEQANEVALKQLDGYIAQYPDILRERATAMTWKGVVLVNLQRFEEAENAFQGVVRLQLGPGDKFGGEEPRAKSAYWLAWLAKRKGNLAEVNQYLGFLRGEFPDAKETADAATLLAN